MNTRKTAVEAKDNKKKNGGSNNKKKRKRADSPVNVPDGKNNQIDVAVENKSAYSASSVADKVKLRLRKRNSSATSTTTSRAANFPVWKATEQEKTGVSPVRDSHARSSVAAPSRVTPLISTSPLAGDEGDNRSVALAFESSDAEGDTYGPTSVDMQVKRARYGVTSPGFSTPVRSSAEESDGSPPRTPHYSPNKSWDDEFNVHAVDTDGYETDLLKSDDQSAPAAKTLPASQTASATVDYSKLEYFDGKTNLAPELDEAFAKILIHNWWEIEKGEGDNREQLKTLYKKYNPPSNCPFDPPLLNTTIRDLLIASHKSVDVGFHSIQKSLTKTMNAVISIFTESQKSSPNFQVMAQTVADIAAILGDASHEVSAKRRAFLRGSIREEYKALCSKKGSRTRLFGDDIAKDIAELNLTNKLKKAPRPDRNRNNKNRQNSQSKSQGFQPGRGNLSNQSRANRSYEGYAQSTNQQKSNRGRGKKRK